VTNIIPHMQPQQPYPALQLGDFVADPQNVLVAGRLIPIGGTTWRIDDRNAVRTRIPTFIVVLAVLLAPCTAFLSLLLLLIKEPHINGMVLIEVSSQGMQMSTRTFVTSPEALDWIRHAVDQAQAWSVAAWGR
jgi:hypothetical protein